MSAPAAASASTSPSSATPANSDWFLLHARMPEISEPDIWRQLLVPPTITTDQLRNLMMAAFGWDGGHLHMWNVRKVERIKKYSKPLKSDLNPVGFAMPVAKIGWENADKPPQEGNWWENIEFSDDDDFGLPTDMTLAELEAKYDLSGHKHFLHYEYDMGDGWEHVIMVEKRLSEAEVVASGAADPIQGSRGKKRTNTGKEKEGKEKRPPIAKITAGSGHCVAEDAGSYPGWENLKDAYEAKGTEKDTERFAQRRKWYETSCANGDPKGLKGSERLEHFDVKEANEMYEMVL